MEKNNKIFEKLKNFGKPAKKNGIFLKKNEKIDFFKKNAVFFAGFPKFFDFRKLFYISDLPLLWFCLIMIIRHSKLI